MAGVLRGFFEKWVPEVNARLEEFYREKKESLPGDLGSINVVSVEYAGKFTLSPGKRVRPILVIAGYMSQGRSPGEDILWVAASIELLHSFLLIHDDVMDRDEVRRGEPTVWKRFLDGLGVDLHSAYSFAITTGDLVYTYALQVILSRTRLEPEAKLEVLRGVLETIEYTGYGQNLDLYLSVTPIERVEPRDVYKMYELKTGLYTVAFPLTLGARLGGGDEETLGLLREYGVRAGIAFQIHDDIIGAFGDPAKTGKPLGSDIREGKKTLLVVEAYRRAGPGERRVIRECLGVDREDCVEKVLRVIRDTGALDEARRQEKRLVDEALSSLRRASVDREIKEFLEELAVFFITRES